MTLVFDTSVLIALERRDIEVGNKIQELLNNYRLPPSTTFLNLFEFLLGIKLKPPRNAKGSVEYVRKFRILNTTERTAELLAELKVKYDREGLVLSLADLVIASLVIENDMILVTRDGDFEKIQELKMELI
ncbi:MAG: type II toxin-antitoxin system VapC family toxin [Nitrososphaerales archaeon]